MNSFVTEAELQKELETSIPDLLKKVEVALTPKEIRESVDVKGRNQYTPEWLIHVFENATPHWKYIILAIQLFMCERGEKVQIAYYTSREAIATTEIL